MTAHDHAEIVPGRLQRIEARLAAATPGPWEGDYDGITQHCSRPEPWEDVVAMHGSDGWGGCDHTLHIEKADAELIAHAPEDLAALVAVVKAVREASDRYMRGGVPGVVLSIDVHTALSMLEES